MTLDEEHGQIDSLMDEAHERRQAIDAQMAEIRIRSQGGQFADNDVDQITVLTQERKRLDGAIQKMVNSPHAPIGYLEHYNQKYMTPEAPPQQEEPEGPGLLSKFFTGVKDTAKFAIQNPKSALAHTYLGAKEFASLPLRGIEGLMDRDIPGIHARQNIKEHQEGLAKADQEAGIDPRGTGPVVFENIGQIAVPVPLKMGPAASLFSRETAKNLGKGAAFGAGAYATERVANDEQVDDAGLMTSGAVGGGLSALLGRFAGRNQKPGAGSGPQAQGKPGATPITPPNAGGTRDNIDPSFARGTSENPIRTQPPRGLRQILGPDPGKPSHELTPSPTGPVKSNLEIEYQPAMVTPPPMRKLGAPEPRTPSPFRAMMESVRAKTQSGEPLTQQEQGFVLLQQRNRTTPPPNAAGQKEFVAVPTRSVSSRPAEAPPVSAQPAPAAAAQGPKPLDRLLRKEPPPQPKPAMPSMADAARGIQEEKLARQAAPPSASPLSVTPKQTQAIPPSQIIDVAGKVDQEVKAAEAEALLSKVRKGEMKAKDVKVKRPKTEAPAPAVQGEAWATQAKTKKIPGTPEAFARRSAIATLEGNIRRQSPNLTLAESNQKATEIVNRQIEAGELVFNMQAKVGKAFQPGEFVTQPAYEKPAVQGEVGAPLPKDLIDIPFAHENYHEHIAAGYSHSDAIKGVRENLKGMEGFTEHEVPDSQLSEKVKAGFAAMQPKLQKARESIERRLDPNTIHVPKEQVRNIAPMKPASKPLKQAETLRPASTVGAGATQNASAAREPQAPKAVPKTATAKLAPETKNIKLEEYIQKEGLQIETKEPFPGEKSYNIKDPITGNTIARGDREQLVNALNTRNEGKGFKLYSGVDPTPLIDKLKEKLAGLPDDITVTNSPHREGPINMGLRSAGLETPQFAMRKTKAGKAVTQAGLDFEDLKQKRFNDLFHEPQKDGTFKDTKAFEYFGADAKEREAVNDALVVGDRIGEHFTPEQLARQGFSTQQIRMYEGVREGLDKVKTWISDMGEAGEEFGSKLKGYIPRVWSGELELFVNGNKHVPMKDGRELGSSFTTLREAASELWKLKRDNPGAKIEAKFFSDPNFLMHRGLKDAHAVSTAKAHIEAMGKLTPEEIESAFKVSKGYKDFAKHLMERKDAKGYETEHLDRVLFSYFNQAAKTVEARNMRNTVEKVMKDHGHELSSSQVQYLHDYVDRVAGKPTWDQMAINSFIRETPIGKWIDPVKAGGAIKTAKQWITYKSLGFGNVSWALVNLDSMTRHVWPMLQRDAKDMGNAFASEKYLGGAIKEFFNNKTLRQKLAHNNVVDIQLMSESRPAVGAHFGKKQITPEDVIMYLGKQTEEFVRGTAAIARYRMALDQGHSDEEAMRVASHFVAETVGRYSKAGKPTAFTGPIGSSVGMFKTYPIVMLQNMFSAFESKDPGVIVRYMLAATAAGGAIGAIPGSEEVDKLATQTLGKSPIQWGYDNLGEGAMTGIASLAPGNMAVDLSRKAGLPDVFPNTTKDWLGPVWNTYAQAIADGLNGEYGEAVKDLIPTSLKNALAVSQTPGKVVGRYDKPLVELAPGTAARTMRGLGFQSPQEVRSLRDYEYLNTLKDSHESELKKLTRKMYARDASPEERQRFQQLGGSNRRIREEGRRETLTLRQRQERQLPRLLRHQRPQTE